MKYFFTILILIIPLISFAQFTVSITPANGSLNVPLNTTITLQFNQAFDSTKGFAYSNIQEWGDYSISSDRRTYSYEATLSPNTTYFLYIQNFQSETGDKQQTPIITYFTTASAFPNLSVSGVVQSGENPTTSANSLVFISNNNPMQSDGSPDFVMATITDNSGNYTIPYLTNGSYYLMAAKEVDGIEGIDPREGDGPDVLSNVDSVVVNNANISGKTLTFKHKYTFAQARDIASVLTIGNPGADSLRRVEAYNVDSTGAARKWDFYYVGNMPNNSHRVKVDYFENGIREIENGFAIFLAVVPIFDPAYAANSTTFIANAENAGGREFRRSLPAGGYFNIYSMLGPLINSPFTRQMPEQHTAFWVANYIKDWYVGEQLYTDGMIFIGDKITGQILKVTNVNNAISNSPEGFSLSQNYPNPFNPNTVISYRLSVVSDVTLKVYDLLGREIATLVNEQKSAGIHSVTFNASNLPSGIYIYRLQAGKYTESKKMILMK